MTSLSTYGPDDQTKEQQAGLGGCFTLFVYLGYICDIGSFLALGYILSLNWVEHVVLLCLAADVLYGFEPGWHRVKGTPVRGSASCCSYSISECALPFDSARYCE